MSEGAGAALRMTDSQWLATVHLALLVTPVGFVCWYPAIAGLGSGRTALLCGIAPVAAVLVGIPTTEHTPGVMVWVGIAVVFTGLAVGLDDRSGDRVRNPTVGSSASLP